MPIIPEIDPFTGLPIGARAGVTFGTAEAGPYSTTLPYPSSSISSVIIWGGLALLLLVVAAGRR